MTFLQLKRRNVPLNRDVLFMAVSDEEGGGVWGTQWMLEHHGDVVRPGYVLDEGGFGQRGVFSAQPDNVYACAVTEKKHLALRVTARGKSGHGALPNTDNPNDILRRALTRIEQTFIRYDGRPPDVLREIERRLSRIRRSSVWDVMRRNTVTVTSLLGWGGDYKDPKVNFIPDRAIATLDCRLLPSEDEAALVQRLNEAIDDGRVTIDILKQTKVTPPYTGYQTPLFGALEKAVKENDPDGIVVPCLLHMSSDSRFFRAKGAVCYGLIPVVLTEEEYYLLHANDERVPVASLENGLRIMYDWVKNFCTETANGTDR
jgi:acetylornithine deacetylase/succinyl-diaminopimelate desuccinylase-like protein